MNFSEKLQILRANHYKLQPVINTPIATQVNDNVESDFESDNDNEDDNNDDDFFQIRF